MSPPVQHDRPVIATSSNPPMRVGRSQRAHKDRRASTRCNNDNIKIMSPVEDEWEYEYDQEVTDVRLVQPPMHALSCILQ